jgi:hypothetical protein
MADKPEKPLSEMTVAELRAEHAHWDRMIRESTGYGCGADMAILLGKHCLCAVQKELARRGECL